MFRYILFAGLFLKQVYSQVAELNQTSYLGRWYQAYSDFAVEATFENNSYCVTADYGVYPNGTISVENRERQYNITGPVRRILGWASAPDSSHPGELQVHLQGTGGFPAPYWVYELGPPTFNGTLYQYSVVSDPLKFTLFVLARNLTLFHQEWEGGVLQRLKDAGFNGFLNTPIPTVQEDCKYW